MSVAPLGLPDIGCCELDRSERLKFPERPAEAPAASRARGQLVMRTTTRIVDGGVDGS